jgi:hypothetical protein
MYNPYYEKLTYARQLREKMLRKFNLRCENVEVLIALRDFLDLRHRLIPNGSEYSWTSYLLIERPASDELIQKLQALTGPHGHTYYKALVARGILLALKK